MDFPRLIEPSPSQPGSNERLRVGVWGPFAGDLAEQLTADTTDIGPDVLESVFGAAAVGELDCLVVGRVDTTQGVSTVYDRLRDHYPDLPLVFVVPEEQRQSVRQCVADDTASRYLTRSGRTVPGDHLAAHIRRVSEPLYVRRRREFYTLWAMAALTFGVGDLVTTLWGVRYTPGVFEGNPIVATILAQFGPAGFVVSKLVALGLLLWFGVQAAHQNDHRTYYAIPILATVLGVGLTVWNLAVVL